MTKYEEIIDIRHETIKLIVESLEALTEKVNIMEKYILQLENTQKYTVPQPIKMIVTAIGAGGAGKYEHKSLEDNKMNWISIKDHLLFDREILITDGEKIFITSIDDYRGMMIDNIWYTLEEWNITHWMPLPSLPETK